jgi:hypothetical protein
MVMALPKRPSNSVENFIKKGLIIGYLYSICLSVAGIAVCEFKGKTCDSMWTQGFAVATGMVTTFLAYLVTPPSIMTSRGRSTPKSDISDGQTS